MLHVETFVYHGGVHDDTEDSKLNTLEPNASGTFLAPIYAQNPALKYPHKNLSRDGPFYLYKRLDEGTFWQKRSKCVAEFTPINANDPTIRPKKVTLSPA